MCFLPHTPKKTFSESRYIYNNKNRSFSGKHFIYSYKIILLSKPKTNMQNTTKTTTTELPPERIGTFSSHRI